MRRLALHSLTYLALLVGVLASLPAGSSFSSDDGAYGGQVAALRQGSWAVERPLPVVAEEHEGWLNTAITPEGPLPYTTSPAYIAVLDAVVRAMHGEATSDEQASSLHLGLHLVPALAAVVAAATAWLVAQRFHPPSAPLAFWVLALGPTLVNATTLWAHTLATALGGIAVLALLVATEPRPRGQAPWPGSITASDPAPPVLAFAAFDGPVRDEALDGSASIGEIGHERAVGHETTAPAPATETGTGQPERRVRLVAVLALTAALAAAAVIRTEALFWVAAVAATALVRARTWTMRLAAVGVGLTGGLAWLANRRWGAALRAEQLPIETSVEVLNGAPSWLASRLPAAWLLLVNGPTGDVGPLFTVVGLSAVGAAIYVSHRPDRLSLRPDVLLAVAAVAYGLRLVLAPDQPIVGLFGAWPAMVACIGLGARRLWPRGRDDDDGPDLWPVAAPAGLLIPAVLATQYASSGGLQWGGRYLSFAFVPLAVVAAVAGRRAVERHRWPLLALLALPALTGAAVTIDLHRHHADAVTQASVGDPDVVITESPALPRIAWGDLPIAHYRATEDDVEPLLDQLAEAGVAVVNVHGLGGADLDGISGYRVTDLDGPVRRLDLRTADVEPD